MLVILGLLAGGALSGKSLIRASEIRSIVADYQRFAAATNSFREKYGSPPGDMANATQYWGYAGVALANCVNRSGTAATTPGVCDGDGDMRLSPPAVAGGAGEDFQFWRHLALAGLIEGNFDGKAGPTTVDHSQPNVNVPKTRIASNSSWYIHYWAPSSGGTQWPDGIYGNSFQVGMISATGWDPNMPIFTPSE